MKQIALPPFAYTLLGVFAGFFIMAVLFITVSNVIAAPTEAPPGGNPVLNVTGPEGPEGPEGPQGPEGSPRTLTCVNRSASFSNSGSGPREAFATCSSDEIVLGGGFYLSDGNSNYLNWNDAWARPTRISVSGVARDAYQCGRNIYGGSGNSACYARCCKLQ